MSVRIPLTIFRNAFASVAGAASSKRDTTLHYVLLEANNDTISLRATDGELSLQTSSPAVVEKPFAAMLEPSKVGAIIKEMTDDEVTIHLDGELVVLSANSSEFRLSGPSPSEFPPGTHHTHVSAHDVAADDLKRGLQRTIIAVDAESTRYALGGIRVEFDSGELSLAATDSRRLAVAKMTSRRVDAGRDNPAAVLPEKAAKLAISMIDDDKCEVSISDNMVSFACGNTILTAKQLQGRFPDWRKVVPSKAELSLNFVCGALHRAVRQSQIVTCEESRGVDFAVTDGMLRLTSQAADVGKSKIEVPLAYDGDPLTVNLDPRFVADFLKCVPAEDSVEVDLIDHESAVKFVADNYTYVVMPLARE